MLQDIVLPKNWMYLSLSSISVSILIHVLIHVLLSVKRSHPYPLHRLLPMHSRSSFFFRMSRGLRPSGRRSYTWDKVFSCWSSSSLGPTEHTQSVLTVNSELIRVNVEIKCLTLVWTIFSLYIFLFCCLCEARCTIYLEIKIIIRITGLISQDRHQTVCGGENIKYMHRNWHYVNSMWHKFTREMNLHWLLQRHILSLLLSFEASSN